MRTNAGRRKEREITIIIFCVYLGVGVLEFHVWNSVRESEFLASVVTVSQNFGTDYNFLYNTILRLVVSHVTS